MKHKLLIDEIQPFISDYLLIGRKQESWEIKKVIIEDLNLETQA